MLVHESVADRFVELLVAKTKALKYGDPMDPDTDMQDAAGRAQVGAHRHLRDHAVGRQRGEPDAHQAGKQVVEQLLHGVDVGHRVLLGGEGIC